MTLSRQGSHDSNERPGSTLAPEASQGQTVAHEAPINVCGGAMTRPDCRLSGPKPHAKQTMTQHVCSTRRRLK